VRKQRSATADAAMVERVSASSLDEFLDDSASAWAAEVVATDRTAFYSHLEENEPSRRLAAELGVVHVCDLVNLTLAP